MKATQFKREGKTRNEAIDIKSICNKGFGPLRESIEQIKAFDQAGAHAAEQMNAFINAFYLSAKLEYMKKYGRLPGSTKTARLRKKQRTLILKRFT